MMNRESLRMATENARKEKRPLGTRARWEVGKCLCCPSPERFRQPSPTKEGENLQLNGDSKEKCNGK
jgi:hypothetical protein